MDIPPYRQDCPLLSSVHFFVLGQQSSIFSLIAAPLQSPKSKPETLQECPMLVAD
jgi:hypothetical protein